MAIEKLFFELRSARQPPGRLRTARPRRPRGARPSPRAPAPPPSSGRSTWRRTAPRLRWTRRLSRHPGEARDDLVELSLGGSPMLGVRPEDEIAVGVAALQRAVPVVQRRAGATVQAGHLPLDGGVTMNRALHQPGLLPLAPGGLLVGTCTHPAAMPHEAAAQALALDGKLESRHVILVSCVLIDLDGGKVARRRLVPTLRQRDAELVRRRRCRLASSRQCQRHGKYLKPQPRNPQSPPPRAAPRSPAHEILPARATRATDQNCV